MQIRNISLDEDQMPDTITVNMGISEAIQIAQWAGKTPSPTAEMSWIYSALCGSVFNRFWDDGVNGAARGDTE